MKDKYIDWLFIKEPICINEYIRNGDITQDIISITHNGYGYMVFFWRE